jgi:RNA polymerase primary sigma factor
LPRRYSESFHSAALADLARQLSFSPPDRRRDQVTRAESLHDQIDPDSNYPLDFVHFRITGYQSEIHEPVLLVGNALQADLRLMIDNLSRTAGIPLTDDDPVIWPADLARELDVSTKTLNRWRRQGLRWRWVIPPGQQSHRLAFPRAGLRSFLDHHQDRVQRAALFSHLDARTRRRLIAHARRLLASQSRLTLNQLSRQLAPLYHRSSQTVRRLLLQYDQEDSHPRLFPQRNDPLSDREKRFIYRAHRLGISMQKLVRRLRRSRSTLYRLLREQQAADCLAQPIQYIPLPVFERDDARQVLLRSLPAEELPADGPAAAGLSTVPVSDLPPKLQPLFVQPLLSRDDQQSLIVRMSYLRHLAAKLRQTLNPHDPRVSDLEQISAYLRRAAAIRSTLVQINLPVVLAVARRHESGRGESRLLRLLDLLEIGAEILIRAIDQYDPSRHSSVERFVSWCLMQHFVREQLKAETTLAEPLGAPLSRAHRREDPQYVLERIVARARSLGVRLEPRPLPPTP